MLGDQGEIHYVFPAVSAGPAGTGNFLIVITGCAISVLATRTLRSDRPVAVLAAFPRHTRLGPIFPGPVIELESMAFEFDEEYAAVVAAADAEIFAPEILPLDPLPEL
ncbi:hypothetical protein FH608_025735 [Nonomuraea phyllanthi]|uniref:Uncharacterized protein n=1 Tax=Nonomuraea phyllanthi TaxID=2219224 RepID=A0A5C4WA63_9ACTN|nr:hypothetical protein [Nonomuraea phyllanthi]KAB8192859.1 hypothetical protein FH608_025735 [Nonomuraea phyllanthi]QFY08337.1 hypothetical protein GBF35_18120 [Nonomuraea phyllanthi]